MAAYLTVTNTPITATLARSVYYYYPKRGNKPEAWAYYFFTGNDHDEDSQSVLYANNEIHMGLQALELHEGAIVEMSVGGDNHYRIILKEQGGGKELRLWAKDKQETTESTNGDSGEANPKDGTQTPAPQTKRNFGQGSPNGDEGIYVEAIVSSHRVFEHPVVKYILWKGGYGKPTLEQLLTIATHFSIGRQQRGLRAPANEDYSSPPPEGRWDKLLEQMTAKPDTSPTV